MQQSRHGQTRTSAVAVTQHTHECLGYQCTTMQKYLSHIIPQLISLIYFFFYQMNNFFCSISSTLRPWQLCLRGQRIHWVSSYHYMTTSEIYEMCPLCLICIWTLPNSDLSFLKLRCQYLYMDCLWFSYHPSWFLYTVKFRLLSGLCIHYLY